LADTERPRSQESARAAMPSERRPSVFTPASHQGQRGHWAAEPGMGRVAHGIPARVDRLRGLGNAVVPQVAEHIGRLIMNAAAA
jgi:DNA (cytosine-5)-methyltransferase 1